MPGGIHPGEHIERQQNEKPRSKLRGIKPNAPQIITDGWPAYSKLEAEGYRQEIYAHASNPHGPNQEKNKRQRLYHSIPPCKRSRG
jgi:hypothetical protein